MSSDGKVCQLPQCTGTRVGLLKFKERKVSKKGEELLVKFELTVPCSLSSDQDQPTYVLFLALNNSGAAPSVATAQKVEVKCNKITGHVKVLPKQTYQVVSYTFNPLEALRFTAGAVDRLLSFHE